jgi:hypothetical protein
MHPTGQDWQVHITTSVSDRLQRYSETALLNPANCYLYLGYTQPGYPLVFFGALASCHAHHVEGMGMRHTKLVTAVRAEIMPLKPIEEVWSISEEEYIRQGIVRYS